MRLDVAALRKSAFWTKHGRVITTTLAPWVSHPNCDYNPTTTLTLITAGMATEGDRGVYVFRGIDRDKTLRCLSAAKYAIDNGVVTIPTKNSVFVGTFVDRSTLVMQSGKQATKATLQQALAVKAPLRSNADVVELERGTQGAALGIIAPPSSKVLAQMTSIGAKMHSAYAYVFIRDDFHFSIKARFADAAGAKQMETMLRPQLDSLKSMVKKLSLNADDTALNLSFGIDDAQLQSIGHMMASSFQ